MRTFLTLLAFTLVPLPWASADAAPADHRSGPLKDLNGDFSFAPPSTSQLESELPSFIHACPVTGSGDSTSNRNQFIVCRPSANSNQPSTRIVAAFDAEGKTIERNELLTTRFMFFFF